MKPIPTLIIATSLITYSVFTNAADELLTGQGSTLPMQPRLVQPAINSSGSLDSVSLKYDVGINITMEIAKNGIKENMEPIVDLLANQIKNQLANRATLTKQLTGLSASKLSSLQKVKIKEAIAGIDVFLEKYLPKIGMKLSTVTKYANDVASGVGGVITVYNLKVTTDEMVKAYDDGNISRFKDKLAEVGLTAGTTIALMVAGAGAIVTIPVGVGIAAIATINDENEKLSEKNKKAYREKLEYLEKELSNEKLAGIMMETLKTLSSRSKLMDEATIQKELKNNFNAAIQYYLDIVDSEIKNIETLKTSRIPVVGEYIGDIEADRAWTEEQLPLYNWLKNQKELLLGLKNGKPEYKKMIDLYTTNLTKIYLDSQAEYLKSNKFISENFAKIQEKEKQVFFAPQKTELKQGKVKEKTSFYAGTFEERLNAIDMNSNTANITGSNFSAVGSAARYFQGTGAADRLAYNNLKVAELRKQTVQEGSTYVNGQIIKAPVDVVLRWGANPSDLDSHLTGPTGNPNNANERFHTYYNQPGNLNSSPNALLYHDDTNSYGPEQTRINVVNPGVYRFYVHDYSDRNAVGSTALSNSGASVTIHQAGNMSLPEGQNLGAQVAQVNVPTGRTGNTWQAFELDSRTGVLNRTTEFRDVSNPTNVPFNQ